MEMDIVISPGRLRPVIENGRVKQRAVFINKQSDQKEMASEIVRSDCLNKGYRIIKGLGSGAYAKVKLAEVSVSKLARHTSMADYLDNGNLQVAVKVIQKKIVPQEFLKKFLPRELDNHSVLPAHPHVVRCFEHFSTSDFTYLIMEYVCNGDLLDMINQTISKNERGLGEDISKKFFRQIALGLRHIHQNGIVHRDMKCENILIDGNSDVKITDFGFSCKYNDRNTLLKTSCGSYAYTAPEVIKNIPYDGTLCDIWSLGIILCGMVNGRLPYNDGHLSEMDEDMRMQTIRFEHNVPLDCMVLVRKLLQYNCLMRPTIEEILSDTWLTGNTPIPRHMHRSKWANSYSINTHDEIGKENVKLRVDGANSRNNASIYYRAVSPEKIKANGTESFVLNTAVRETIILKSRQLSNAYREISPRNERRPKTWPKSVREQAEKIKSDVRSLSEYKHISERIRQLMNVTKDRARAKLVKKVNKKGATKPCDYTPLMYMYKYLQPDGQIQQRSPSPPMSPKHKTKLVTTHILPAANKPSPTKFVSIRGPETHQHKDSSRMPTVDSHCKQRMMMRKKRIALAKLADLENTDVPDLDMINLNMVSKKEKIPPEGRIKSVPARGNRQSGLGLSSERQTPAERAKSCRDRFVQTYSKKKTGIPGQKIPIPSLMVQKHENDGELELGLGIRAPYSIQGRSRSTSPEKHSVKTIYKYKYH